MKGDVHDETAPGDFYDWQRTSSFQDVAAYGGIYGSLAGSHHRLPEHVNGAFCSWNLFRTLGVQPSIGRVFSPNDDSAQAARNMILSDGVWKHRFGGDPKLIGRPVRFDGELYRVIGVMPRDFEFPSATTQFWVPMQIALRPRRSRRGRTTVYP